MSKFDFNSLVDMKINEARYELKKLGFKLSTRYKGSGFYEIWESEEQSIWMWINGRRIEKIEVYERL